jgi:hypothetical protein
VDHAVVADLQRPRLFRVRHQQVLGQAPVEEDARAVDVLDLEAGELAHLHLGLLGGGDQLVFAVQVDEHVQPVIEFQLCVFREIAPQQDLAIGAAVQVQAEVHVFHDLQTVVAPKQSHFR